jgi:DNA-binding YbaB/EbfC family protein
MFNLFNGMSQLASVMRNLPKLKEGMEQLQQRLPQIVAEGDAGAGMVKVRFNGRMEMTACVLSEDVLKMNDHELLEDLIKAAVNQALSRAREQVQEETHKVISGLGVSLPPGMTIPGLG